MINIKQIKAKTVLLPLAIMALALCSLLFAGAPNVAAATKSEQLAANCRAFQDLIKVADKKNKAKYQKKFNSICKGRPKNADDVNKRLGEVKKLNTQLGKIIDKKKVDSAKKKYKKECKTKAQKKTAKCKNLKKTIDKAASSSSGGGLGAKPGALKKISASSVGVPTGAADNDALEGILNGVYQLAGVVAVIVMIVAGLRMVLGGDNPDTVATARRMIIYASAGLVVIISAFVITQFIINAGSI